MAHSMIHRSEQEILDGMPFVRNSPADNGILEAIVIRPDSNLRQSLTECRLSPERGTEGDIWARRCWLKLEGGQPHPDVQICMMNSRMIQLLAGDQSRWEFAGDNLFIDLDISHDNLRSGQRLQIGDCIIEITAQAHNGCTKFGERFGAAAVKFVNSLAGKQLRLRGIYAKVIREGIVHVGDNIKKI